MKVKRLTQGCCGMTQGKVYEAKWKSEGFYVCIKLDNGQWTSSHWFPGCFEVIT